MSLEIQISTRRAKQIAIQIQQFITNIATHRLHQPWCAHSSQMTTETIRVHQTQNDGDRYEMLHAAALAGLVVSRTCETMSTCVWL